MSGEGSGLDSPEESLAWVATGSGCCNWLWQRVVSRSDLSWCSPRLANVSSRALSCPRTTGTKSVESGTGGRAGERETGSIVPELKKGWRVASESETNEWLFLELKSSCERVIGVFAVARTTDLPWTWVKRSYSMVFSLRAFSSCSSSWRFRISRASTSRRFRSREDCAARRFRRTRSTRRCSFSSSVFARFLHRGKNKVSTVMHITKSPPKTPTGHLPRREIRFRFGKHLAPRFPFLRRLLFRCRNGFSVVAVLGGFGCPMCDIDAVLRERR